MTRIINRLVNGPSKTVKNLLFLGTYFILANAQAAPLSGYSEVMVKQSLIWAPNYLRTFAQLYSDTPRARLAVQLSAVGDQIVALSLDQQITHADGGPIHYIFDWKKNGPVRFQAESSGVFLVPSESQVRDAVTGDEIDSPVIFNLDRISDPATFTYGDALRLWVHEFGHKVKAQHPEVTQEQVDEIASLIAKHYQEQSWWSDQGRLLITNGPPHNSPGQRHYAFKYLDSTYNSFIVLKENDALVDLSHSFSVQLDRFISPYANYYETDRFINQVRWVSQNEALVELKTYRMPKNLNSYEQTDLGGPHFKLCHIRLNGTQIEVLTCAKTLPIPQRATDASAQLSHFQMLADGNFSMQVEITLQTERFFHAPGYPTANAFLLAYSGAQAFRIPVKLNAQNTEAWAKMPAEIYKKTTVQKAWLEGMWPTDAGPTLEITGLISRFFELGTTWPETWDESFKLIRLMKPVLLSNECEASLLGLKSSK